MNKLIIILNNIENDNLILKEQYKIVERLANKYLITDCGQSNWENINILEKNGFYVYPVEQDSFGWITAAIFTTKGDIMYG
jgi:hypothetical protein